MAKYWFKFRYKDWLMSDKVQMMTQSQKGDYIDMLARLHNLEDPAYLRINGKNLTKSEVKSYLNFSIKSLNFFISTGHLAYDEVEKVFFQPNILEEAKLSESKKVGADAKWSKERKENAMHNALQNPDSDSDSNSVSNNKNNIIGEFYEKNIGMLTPYVCEELIELEKEHKEQNVVKALKLTAEAGVRSIRYVKAILDSEAVGGYKFEKIPKTVSDPLLGKLPPVIRKQVEHMIEEFIKNTGEQPKEENIKIMIKKVTHE